LFVRLKGQYPGLEANIIADSAQSPSYAAALQEISERIAPFEKNAAFGRLSQAQRESVIEQFAFQPFANKEVRVKQQTETLALLDKLEESFFSADARIQQAILTNLRLHASMLTAGSGGQTAAGMLAGIDVSKASPETVAALIWETAEHAASDSPRQALR